jgi:diguanylate cyclase (GGDEF)-like protein
VLGCLAGEYLSKMLADGGDVLLLTPGYQHRGMDLRRRGFVSTLAERNELARIVGTLEDFEDPTGTYDLVSRFLPTHPKLRAIYSTEAIGVIGAASAVRDARREDLVLVCHDLVKGTLELVKSGRITATVWQDPFGQGYDVVVHLFNAVAFGWRPKRPRIISASAVVTQDDCDKFWRSQEGSTVDRSEPLAQPLGVSSKPIKIAVLGSLFSDFWRPIADGTRAAGRLLADCNARVELIMPDGPQEHDSLLTGAVVDRLVAEGYDAIATFVIDWLLVPYLNNAVDHGVLVATYNSENADLHSSVTTLSDERERLEGLAHQLADSTRRDPLTGIRNRVGMDEELAQAFASWREEPIAIVMLDIDHFKRYNDSHGHAGGDEVLRRVAQRLQVALRPHDLVYRVGGEEFLVLLRGTGIAEAAAVAERLVRSVEELRIPHTGNPVAGVVTITAGVAEPHPKDATIEEAISRADGALYRAKRSGRNKVA